MHYAVCNMRYALESVHANEIDHRGGCFVRAHQGY